MLCILSIPNPTSPTSTFFFVKIPAVKTRLVPTCYLCVFRVREGWDQVEAREDSWKGTKENFFIALLLLPASKLPYLGKQSEPRENARTRGLSPAFSRDSLYLACVASVSNRVIPWGLHQFPRASSYPRSSLTRKKVRVCILKDCQHIVKKNPVARSKISILIKSPRYFFQWIFNLSTVTSYSRMEGGSLPRL